MSISSADRKNFNILPYDFVKENQIIASQNGEEYEVISPNKITPTVYHELYKFLKKILFSKNAAQFNLTNF